LDELMLVKILGGMNDGREMEIADGTLDASVQKDTIAWRVCVMMSSDGSPYYALVDPGMHKWLAKNKN
jgi:hypothetical protein